MDPNILSLKQRVEEAKRQAALCGKRKSALEGRLEAEKTNLRKILDKAKEKGYDPRNLEGEKTKRMAAIEEQVATAEKALREVESQLDTYEQAVQGD